MKKIPKIGAADRITLVPVYKPAETLEGLSYTSFLCYNIKQFVRVLVRLFFWRGQFMVGCPLY